MNINHERPDDTYTSYPINNPELLRKDLSNLVELVGEIILHNRTYTHGSANAMQVFQRVPGSLDERGIRIRTRQSAEGVSETIDLMRRLGLVSYDAVQDEYHFDETKWQARVDEIAGRASRQERQV